MIYTLLLVFWSAATVWLWRSADRRARVPRPWLGRPLRVFFAAFFLSMLLYVPIPLLRAVLEAEPQFPPTVWATAAYLWFPIILNATLGAIAAGLVWRGVRRLVRRRPGSAETLQGSGTPPPGETEEAAPSPAVPAPQLTRRQALGLVAAVLPPVATVGLTAVAMAQRGGFRVRRLELPVPGLPGDLDGLTIAHVTDLHAGNFVPPDATARLAEVVNRLGADLVAFTGDLVDRGLLDRLPLGLDFIDRLDRRDRLVMIEGNHDVLEDALKFEQAVRARNLPLLLDEERTIAVGGRRTPVQFLGIGWGELISDAELKVIGGDPDRMLRVYSEEMTADAVRRVANLRRPDAFPILLAHHPHALEPAAAARLPLVLSGHTHGGQMMLTDHVGAGPLRFRYWNGVHRAGPTTLTICNGVGSWFPLRVNAPAEVVHLTLRHAAAATG